MAAIKPEESEHSIWQSYALQPPHTSHQTAFESNFPSGPLALPYHARQKGGYRSMDIPSIHTRPPHREGNGVLTASPPSLNSHHSYPSLKRPFHSTDDSPYGEVVQDFREDLSEHPKPNISQDHRLLSFSKRQPKHTIVDQHGRIQQLDLSAQIHGMFFLSEMTTPTGEGVIVQPELTCYRRNLFQISGSVTTPRGALSVITERGERIPILSLEVTISATESVDGHSVKLIVIPWKTPPPNSPEVTPGQEQEPSPIPLLPFDDGAPDTNNEFAVYPIAYRRLQFRIATANNGRRRELQQHFTLHLNVVGTLGNNTKINVCETATAPIVVRGRSPRNFQARKEIALVGSSASRAKHQNCKSQVATLELPRSPFNFDASNLPVSPHLMRQQTLPSWFAPPHSSEHTPGPSTPNYQGPPPSLSMDNYLQGNHSSSENPQNHSPASTMPAPAPPVRSYTYHSTTSPGGAPIRFIDSNPRPAKSPRHQAPPELNSSFSSDFTARFNAPAPYSSASDPAHPREYFPTSMSMQPWTTAQDTASTYGTTLPAVTSSHYEYPGDQHYVKEEGHSQPPPPHQQPSQQHYTWSAA
ncbi:putative ndt80 like dna-binding family protein [Botrytis fragariae]|uniref:Putative ndt80 like dna-binding family protein n=1 Tax=Botrytis fragariae TaxID=1964551 RepID=A0A8H6B5H0_9HELO|nr:putative ndt80 like dna-binding family protein [Botrytis fragariae]KAF5879342.1 putative ndt80 like dna-binding family protein [Botrytis fragariae]